MMHTFTNTEFTRSMKKSHTIYMPEMLHYHNELLCAAFAFGGYKLAVVPEQVHICHETQSLVNKDYCTCAMGIVGNLLTFVKSDKCDREHIAFLEPQAGGACRAGNYYNLIIECLQKMGYGQIPVLSLNAHGLEQHSGFKINARMLIGAIAAVCHSDLLMDLTQQIRPYEINAGETERLRQQWLQRLTEEIRHGRHLFYRKKVYREIVESFGRIPVDRGQAKKKVGVVGEIYIKCSPVGNRHLEDYLQKNGCDYRMGGFVNYCIYVVYSEMKSLELGHQSRLEAVGYQKVLQFLYHVQKEIAEALEQAGFLHDRSFQELLAEKKDILSDYYNIGDGWLMTAEIIDLIKKGYDKILVVHPFGCLISHVGGRGVLKALHERFPEAKITSIEYDYDQSDTLRESRVLLAIE